jgi:hypothetical protein
MTRYVCVPRPYTAPTCQDCDLACMQQETDSLIQAQQRCYSYPEELQCGPDPEDPDNCCYVALVAVEKRCPE